MGGFNGLKMLIARGDGPRIGTLARRIGTTAFFGMHYGTFWTVHGVFVWTFLPLFAQSRGVGLDDTRRGLESTVSLGPDAGAVVLGAIVLALSHGASFLFNYIGRGEYLRMTVARQMGAPYGRVVALHLAILGGGFVGFALGTPIGALVILVLLKTALDAGFHLGEHRAT